MKYLYIDEWITICIKTNLPISPFYIKNGSINNQQPDLCQNLFKMFFYFTSFQSSVNYSKKAIKNHHGEVPVFVHTNIKHAQQTKNYDTTSNKCCL